MRHGILYNHASNHTVIGKQKGGPYVAPDASFGLFAGDTITLNGRTYRFEGYKSSILKYLCDNGQYEIVAGSSGVAADAHNTDLKRHLCIGGAQVGKTAGQAITELAQHSALSLGGELDQIDQFMTAPAMLQQGNDAFNIARAPGEEIMSRIAHRQLAARKPGSVKRFLDRTLNERIIVDISSYIAPTSRKYSKVVETGQDRLTFSMLAAVVGGLP